MAISKIIGACFICLLVAAPQQGYGQVKTSITFSNPWVNKAKALNKTRKEYKKYCRDSLKRLKKLDKYYKHRFDSIANTISQQVERKITIAPADIQTLNTLKKQRRLYQQKKDAASALLNDATLQEKYQHKEDSIKHLIGKLSEKYGGIPLSKFKKYKAQHSDSLLLAYGKGYLKDHHFSVEQLDSLSSLFPDSIKYTNLMSDSLLLQQLTSRLESYVYTIDGMGQLQSQQQRILAEQNKLNAYKADFNRYRDKKNLKSKLQKLSQSEAIAKNKILNKAHKSLSAYKKKYLTLPSLNHLEGGIKRSSLKGKTFWERIKVGGNLRVSQQKYINIDFAPSLAYLINRKWAIGSELVFRGQFGKTRQWHSIFDSDTYGFRVFSDYSLYKSFFVHAEFEKMHTTTVDKQSERKTTQYVPGAMIGMGKTFALGKNVKGKVLLQYNFIHDKTKQLYASPWVVRFGFEINKKPKL